jgi:nucleotide-binding universal stress UspA family protein
MVSMHARYRDLAVLGQEYPDEPQGNGWTAALEGALLSPGRPILVVPYAGRFSGIGSRVLVGWNAGRGAAHAIHDALPFIANADTISIVAVDPKHGNPGHGNAPAADLARHGLRVTAMQATSGGLDPSDVLLNYAANQSSDLIVVGGYGHSRARKIVFGGVTRDLLRDATVPVLMSH